MFELGRKRRRDRPTCSTRRNVFKDLVPFGPPRRPLWGVLPASLRFRDGRAPALALACLSVGLAACNSGEGKPQLTTPTPPPAVTTTVGATTTTIDPVEHAVLDGYRAFWAAYLRAADPMDPKHPDLAATATGQQLEQVQKAFLARRAGDEVIRGTIDVHPRLATSVAGASATVVDCYTDDTHLYDAKSGAQKDEPGPSTERVTADMVLVGSVWKVAAIHHEATGCSPA